MKITILSRNPKLYSTSRLLEEAEKNGVASMSVEDLKKLNKNKKLVKKLAKRYDFFMASQNMELTRWQTT